MCGIIGILSEENNVSYELFEALLSLQHRGQDAAGMLTCTEKGNTHLRKKSGTVASRFAPENLDKLKGTYGIGHVRYPTAGTYSQHEAQPFYINFPFGLSLVHNGNIVNTEELTKFICSRDLRHINTSSDSDILLNLFSYLLFKNFKKEDYQLTDEIIFETVKQFYSYCHGGYAICILIVGYGIVAFRDPNGIRPIVYGKRNISDSSVMRSNSVSQSFMIASESVALDACGYELKDDVGPGEVIILKKDMVSRRACSQPTVYSPCIFEYVYFSQPDSIMNGVTVYNARMNIGEKLAMKIKKQLSPEELSNIDLIIPVPDTSRPSAIVMAQHLGIEYCEGLIKNRYISRTFIMPNDITRNMVLKRKHNAIGTIIKNKNVLLVDDSIVRGNTARHIIDLTRNAGAKKIYFASCAPPIKYQNVYGIDIPTRTELIAHNRNLDQIKDYIHADYLIYQDLPDLISAIKQENPGLDTFDTSVFDGVYVTNDLAEDFMFSSLSSSISEEYLANLENGRKDSGKNVDNS